jgi:hypothetical protein
VSRSYESNELGGDRAFGYSKEVRLDELAPGDYTLAVAARSSLGPAAVRQVPFTVAAPVR